MQNDLISRSALLEEIALCTIRPDDIYGMGIMSGVDAIKKKVENAPAVDAVPVESLGKIGKLFLPYKGCPRGPVGRMGLPATLEEEALQWGVITDVDGGRWVPVVEDVLHELIAKANDPESLRPKGRWEIHCHSTYDSWTQETDENFYLECSECKRQVWDIDQMAAMNEDIRKLTEQYPYCHCGCKMEV